MVQEGSLHSKQLLNLTGFYITAMTPHPTNDTENDKPAFHNLTPWAKRDASPQQDGQPEPVETGIVDVMGQPRGQG